MKRDGSIVKRDAATPATSDLGYRQQWQYIKTYLIDHVYGDWYEEGLDKEPQRKTALKGHIWKGNYHNFRALENCIERLNNGGAGE